jgi:hypothetical protein
MFPDADISGGKMIWKSHHSLCDGVSVMSMNLQLDESYDVSKLLNFPDVSLWLRIFMRL